jgi:hypothetical protein
MSHPFSAFGAIMAATLFLAISSLMPAQAQEPAAKQDPETKTGGAIMTPDFFQKMLQLVTDKGTNREMPRSYAAALGFAGLQEKWAYRGIIGSDDDEHQHSFNIGLKSSRDIAIVIRDLKSIRASRVDSSGKVLSAVVIDLVTGDCTARPPADAQKEINAEIDLWNSKVDTLLAAKKSK